MTTLTKRFDYVHGEPALIISKEGYKRAFVILLSAVWKYRIERHQPIYGAGGEIVVYDDQKLASDEGTRIAVHAMLNACNQICIMFGLIASSRTYAEIASFIEDSIEDLIKMPPPPEKERKIIGEGKTTLGGLPHHFPLKEGDFSC